MSPPESFEKRQRSRRKEQKRREKLERKLRRKALKNRGPLFHTMHRGDEQYRFETDLWLSVLDLVCGSGWTPPETLPSEEPASTFVRPAGLTLTEEVAQGLAQAIENLLPEISDEELPLSDFPYGEKHTANLLARRATGAPPEHEDAAAAYELLSGAPKQEVERLAAFLKEGSASIEAD